MTTSEPDPRTDLAGWLGLTETQANICRRDARSGYADIRGILGARLVAQDQADTPDPEPDDGLIAVTLRLTADGFGASRAIHLNSFSDSDYGRSARKLTEACRDLPAPKPPWTSPLPNLPDLTEQEARYIWDQFDAEALEMDGETERRLPLTTNALRKVARALKAAGWTPEGEA